MARTKEEILKEIDIIIAIPEASRTSEQIARLSELQSELGAAYTAESAQKTSGSDPTKMKQEPAPPMKIDPVDVPTLEDLEYNAGITSSGGLSKIDPNEGDKEEPPKSVGDQFKDWWGGMSNGTKAGLIGNAVGKASDVISTAFVDKSQFAADDPTVNSTGRLLYDATANALMQFSPVGTIAGGAMKALGLANDLLGSKTQDFAVDLDTLNTIGGSYGGSSANISEAQAKAGKKYGLLAGGARKKANKFINEARRQQSAMLNIAKDVRDFADSSSIMSQVNGLGYKYQIDGGYDQRYLRAAKKGAKITYFNSSFNINLSNPDDKFKVSLEDIPMILRKGGTLLDKLDKEYSNKFDVVLSDVPEIASLKKGGQIKDREIDVIEVDTNLKSVIPEGALHKNKHHLGDIGVDDSELTKKGIPVVDNDGDQQAEIELNEIIFTLEVTKELEKRYKEYYLDETSKDRQEELALEAGKLLWKEIIFNTDDRTGLIGTLKKGGSIETSSKEATKEKPKERIDKLIEYAKLQNPRFILRMSEPLKYITLSNGEFATHMMAAEYDDRDNLWYVFPLVFEDDNGLLVYEPNQWKALDINKAKGNVLKFDNREDALLFSESPDINTGYKRGWPEFFKQTPEYKKGGIITQEYIDNMVKQALINLLTK